MGKNAIESVQPLGFPYKTPDPFLFCVYHKDDYPAGDEKMQAPKMGNGADFDWSLPYRMYHGDRVPGFPQHPHRGFETVTVTTEGLVDHTDSKGNGGRYGHGDLQWMTAGGGIVHGEMFPLVNKDKANPLRLFQIWLNLPARSKMVEPAFEMHWAESIPKIKEPGATVTLYAGTLQGIQALNPPPASWASDPANEVAIYHVALEPGASWTIPPAAGGSSVNRYIYFVDGSKTKICDRDFSSHSLIILKPEVECPLQNTGSDEVQVLMLQGKPINEPVVQHGPFVMNTRQEIQQAFMDYQRTQFGGWPWPDDAVIFPREKGRFANFGGKEEYPPSCKQ